MKGIAEDAKCPTCGTYTTQEIVRRGVRLCLGCRTEFNLKDTVTLRRVRRAAKRRVTDACTTYPPTCDHVVPPRNQPNHAPIPGRDGFR